MKKNENLVYRFLTVEIVSQLPGHWDVQTKETGSAKILMDIKTQQINFSFTWKV
jgi:hypothetical protein